MPANSYEKPDFWSQKAFSEGYPARSVYKLKEIDEKFGMIKKNYTVLDLGAAPGSWTTFLLRKMEGSGKVVACDLNPLAKSVKGDNLFFIQGDLNAPEIRKVIKENGPYDLVVCDAAPKTTGNRTVDTARSKNNGEQNCRYSPLRAACRDGRLVCSNNAQKRWKLCCKNLPERRPAENS